jgi:FKBP-type peptidyl-prolyl cis-trans isomerase
VHRAAVVVLSAVLVLAACGSDDDSEASAEGSAETVEAASADDGSAEAAAEADANDSASSDPADGGEDADGDGTTDAVGTASGAGDDTAAGGDGAADKPDVEIPDAIPDELDVTTLVEGDGPEAAAGDTLIVDYVGVRTEDGVEFDNSYERGQPLAVTLGSGGVIEGWDLGLVGARAGERRQLDIPSDLAYGSEARSEVIREDEALTFVVDVRSVISSDPDDAPVGDLDELGVDHDERATEVTTVDLVEGDGDVLEMGDTAVFHFVLFRADNGAALDSTWTTQPIQLPLEEGNFPGLLDGLPGMRVGGRRAITVPPEDGFGPDGNPQLGLPADTDIVLVVDLLGTY